MEVAIRFLLGLGIGSFINVIALRYEGDAFLLHHKVIGGRSRCPYCRTNLRWFELVPLLSFLFLRARCHTCGAKISFQYPLVELAAGLIFVFVPVRLGSFLALAQFSPGLELAMQALWVLALATLLLVALIDLRTYLIPNELNVFLAAVGLLAAFLGGHFLISSQGSFVGPYSLLLGFRDSVLVNRLFAGFLAALFFLLIVFLSKGRGMGMGDVKFVGALGLLFGWPDIVLIVMLSFIFGGVVGAVALIRGTKKMKSRLPFGPFLSLAAVTVFFFGETIVRGYFALFPVL